MEFKYRDLMVGFEKVLGARTRTNDSFPTTIGINAFRGFIDEFSKKKERGELTEVKVKVKAGSEKVKKKKKKYNIVVSYVDRVIALIVCGFFSEQLFFVRYSYA